MQKITKISVIALLAICLFSCETKERCYEVTYTTTDADGNIISTKIDYIWATDAFIKSWVWGNSFFDVNITYKKSPKSKSDCKNNSD